MKLLKINLYNKLKYNDEINMAANCDQQIGSNLPEAPLCSSDQLAASAKLYQCTPVWRVKMLAKITMCNKINLKLRKTVT